jgi:hypothetical protein
MIVEPRTNRGRSVTRLEVEQAERGAAPAWLRAIFGDGRIPDEDRETLMYDAGLRGEVWLEGEIVDPASGRWRTCHVRIRQEQVLAVLKRCREAAAEIRSQAMT